MGGTIDWEPADLPDLRVGARSRRLICRNGAIENRLEKWPQELPRTPIKIDVRQGIARARRHVAPARLLC
jgi:hypothetical protein